MRHSRATGALASLSQAPALEEPVQTSSSQGADSNVKQSAKGAMPIEAFRSELLKKIERDQVTIICGETGSGKSTRLPVFIYEQAQAQSKVRCSICQPVSGRLRCVSTPLSEVDMSAYFSVDFTFCPLTADDTVHMSICQFVLFPIGLSASLPVCQSSLHMHAANMPVRLDILASA